MSGRIHRRVDHPVPRVSRLVHQILHVPISVDEPHQGRDLDREERITDEQVQRNEDHDPMDIAARRRGPVRREQADREPDDNYADQRLRKDEIDDAVIRNASAVAALRPISPRTSSWESASIVLVMRPLKLSDTWPLLNVQTYPAARNRMTGR